MTFELKNGQVHAYWFTLIATRFVKTIGQYAPEYNEKINLILSDLQNQGYEIIDVKLVSGYSQGLGSLVRKLILYK